MNREDLREREVLHAVMAPEPEDTGFGQGTIQILRATHETPVGPIHTRLNLVHLDNVRFVKFGGQGGINHLPHEDAA